MRNVVHECIDIASTRTYKVVSSCNA